MAGFAAAAGESAAWRRRVVEITAVCLLRMENVLETMPAADWPRRRRRLAPCMTNDGCVPAGSVACAARAGAFVHWSLYRSRALEIDYCELCRRRRRALSAVKGGVHDRDLDRDQSLRNPLQQYHHNTASLTTRCRPPPAHPPAHRSPAI